MSRQIARPLTQWEGREDVNPSCVVFGDIGDGKLGSTQIGQLHQYLPTRLIFVMNVRGLVHSQYVLKYVQIVYRLMQADPSVPG